MTDTLKPCPFCGEPAELDTRQSFRSVFDGQMLEQVSVYCTSCSADISHYPGDLSWSREDTTELCITAWNTRATPPAWPTDARFQYGDRVRVIVKREGQPRFPGYVIGWYQPRDGRHYGWVLEHERDGIIHVNPDAAVEWEV